MSDTNFLRYEAKGIAGLLRTYLLAVPFYQRSYSWKSLDSPASSRDADAEEKAQVSEFWEDLFDNFASKRSYFLGTVVLANDGTDNRRLVIDGQQRLATTSLLVACIRDEFKKWSEDAYAESAQHEFIGRFDRRIGSVQPNLILNSDDREYYINAVLDGSSEVNPGNHSQALLQSAYRFLRERVRELANDAGSDWKNRLNEFLEYLNEDVQVVAIDVATQADAFLIFETLNDRGADLTVADLLKNYLFSQSGERLDEVRDHWVTTLANLDLDTVGNQRFTNFARHLMSSKFGRTRERELYARIRNSVSGAASTVKFAQELKDSSRLYYALLAVDSDFWSDFSESTRQAVEVLVDLNLEQYRPLLLAALDKFGQGEIERFIPSMVSWTVRGLAAGALGAGTAEYAFCEAAREIRAGNVTSTEGLLGLRRISVLITSDDTFHADFSNWRVTRGPLARYLLRALEMTERGEVEPELVVNDNSNQVNLEHILPKSAKVKDWPQFTEEESKIWAHRLGNLCLLQKGPNGRIGNKSWAAKSSVLGNSKLLLTSRLGANETWGKEQIIANQGYLADLALKCWPRVPRD